MLDVLQDIATGPAMGRIGRWLSRSALAIGLLGMLAAVAAGVFMGLHAGLSTLAGGWLAALVVAGYRIMASWLPAILARGWLVAVLALNAKLIFAVAMVYVFIAVLGLDAVFVALGFSALPLGLIGMSLISPLPSSDQKV